MAIYGFGKPVKVILGPVVHIVTNTRQAAELLTTKWPMKNSANADLAKRALLLATSGPHDDFLIEKAREAFADAAAEAEILLPDRR